MISDHAALRRRLVGALSIGLVAALASAAQAGAVAPAYRGPLYEHSVAGPGGESRRTVACGDAVSIYNTTEPRYELFLPDRKAATGAGVVMLPGGGLRLLSEGGESDAEVEAFLRHGMAVLRLEYRTLPIPPQVMPRTCPAPSARAAPPHFPKMEIHHGNANPAPEDAALSRVLEFAIADAQASLRLMRRRGGEWSLDPRRIGVIGVSAGGGVGFGAVLANASADAKPSFLVSIYGPALQDVAVPRDAPPVFLVTEADHGPVTDGLLSVFSLWKDAGRRAELHVYDVPAFSMTVDLWGDRLFEWLKERGFLDEPK